MSNFTAYPPLPCLAPCWRAGAIAPGKAGLPGPPFTILDGVHPLQSYRYAPQGHEPSGARARAMVRDEASLQRVLDAGSLPARAHRLAHGRRPSAGVSVKGEGRARQAAAQAPPSERACAMLARRTRDVASQEEQGRWCSAACQRGTVGCTVRRRAHRLRHAAARRPAAAG